MNSIRLYLFLVGIFLVNKFSIFQVEHPSKISKYKIDSKDTSYFIDSNMRQWCINADRKAFNDFALNQSKKNNFINASKNNYLKVKIRTDLILGEIYFYSCKDFIQKLSALKKSGDTLYLKLMLVKKGIDEDMSLHKIKFEYKNSKNLIKHIVLIQ